MCICPPNWVLDEELEHICQHAASIYDPDNPKPANDYVRELTNHMPNYKKYQILDRTKHLINLLTTQ